MKAITLAELENNKDIVIHWSDDDARELTETEIIVITDEDEGNDVVDFGIESTEINGITWQNHTICFCKFAGYTANMSKDELSECIFYSNTPSGMAYKGDY